MPPVHKLSHFHPQALWVEVFVLLLMINRRTGQDLQASWGKPELQQCIQHRWSELQGIIAQGKCAVVSIVLTYNKNYTQHVLYLELMVRSYEFRTMAMADPEVSKEPAPFRTFYNEIITSILSYSSQVQSVSRERMGRGAVIRQNRR